MGDEDGVVDVDMLLLSLARDVLEDVAKPVGENEEADDDDDGGDDNITIGIEDEEVEVVVDAELGAIEAGPLATGLAKAIAIQTLICPVAVVQLSYSLLQHQSI